MVLFGGCAWFYSGACVVLFGGMRGFIRGRVHGFILGVCGFFSFFGYNEIRSMSGRYASYWNAFLLALWSMDEKVEAEPKIALAKYYHFSDNIHDCLEIRPKSV